MIGTLNYSGASHSLRASNAYRFEQECERQSEREKSIETVTLNILRDCFTDSDNKPLALANDNYSEFEGMTEEQVYPLAVELAERILDGDIPVIVR